MNNDVPATKPQPVLIIMSLLAGAVVVSAGLMAIPEVPRLVASLFALGVAATVQGMAYYIRGQVVPLSDTAAYVNDQRELIAGPASNVRTGAPAEVLPADEGR